MVKLYVMLIKRGLKTINDVPINIRSEVESLLN
jgi:hypothetical protein